MRKRVAGPIFCVALPKPALTLPSGSAACSSALRRIAFIVFAQKMGLSLDEIAGELAKLPENRVPQSSDWARLSASWTRRIDERIAELERLRAGLTQCIGCGCLSLKHCQLANPADYAAGLGAGPRYLLSDTRRPKK
jgi:MerR family transcriptional regulator, redox-sensitive transcriptional activator SoxR